jgi:hypothetical protein
LPNRSEVAEGIIRATGGWPSSVVIRGLVSEYRSQSSEEKRVVILLDILDCLRQDLDAASPEPTELKALMARMSGSRSKFLGVPRRRGCAHVSPHGTRKKLQGPSEKPVTSPRVDRRLDPGRLA